MSKMFISPLQELAIRSGVSKAIQALEQKLSLPDARDKHGNSLLMIAAKYGKLELVDYFYDKGVPVDIVNKESKSALDLALESGQIQVKERLEFILRQKADGQTEGLSRSTEEDLEINVEKDNLIDQLSGWEAEEIIHKPEEDGELIEQNNDLFDIIKSFRPTNSDESWEYIELSLPAANSLRSIPDVTEYPMTFELLVSAASNSIPLFKGRLFATLEDDVISGGAQLSEEEWLSKVETIGVTLLDSPSADFLDSGLSFDTSSVPELFELDSICFDVLAENRDLSEDWIIRVREQAENREVLEKLEEERLGQRMDSCLIAIRNVFNCDEGREVIWNVASDEPIPEGCDQDEADYEDRDESGTDQQILESPFINFLKAEKVDPEVMPPRPSFVEISKLKTESLIISEKLSSQLTLHYGRYIAVRNLFFNANLRLAISIAKRYRPNRHRSLEDNIQSGFIGMLKAIEKFDYRQGFKFSTYAVWWIRQQISRDIADSAGTIRIPVHAYETLRRIIKARSDLERNHSKINTQNIAIACQLDQPTVQRLLGFEHSWTNLEYLDDIELEQLNYVSLSDCIDPYEDISEFERKRTVDAALSNLQDREKEIVERRFGISNGEEETLEEIGQAIGVTRERIRQIESKCLNKLRTPSRSAYFEGEELLDMYRLKRDKEIGTDVSENQQGNQV